MCGILVSMSNISARSTAKPGRKLMSLPHPTHNLISRVAGLRDLSMSDALYVVFREELRRQEDGDAWAFAPSPFSIKPTYEEDACRVLIWNPWLPTLKLNRREASDLAEAIHTAVEGTTPDFDLVTERDGCRVTITRGGHHVSLHVDGKSYPMVRPLASDVADAIISASVHAGPLARPN